MFDRENFAKFLIKARGNRSINQYGLHSKVDPGYISRLSRGLIKTPPSPDVLKKLAEHAYGGVTYEDFMIAAGYLPENKPALPPGSIPVTDWVRVPIYGEIRAGAPMLVQEEIIGWEYVPAEDVKGGEYFFLRVKGDSMINARLQEGDLVLVRKQDVLENGQIGVVIVDGEATIKKFYRQGMNVVLQPANPAYAPIVARIQDVRIIGEVVEAKIKFNGR